MKKTKIKVVRIEKTKKDSENTESEIDPADSANDNMNDKANNKILSEI